MKLGQKVRTPPTGNESHVVVDRVEDPLSGVSGVRVVVVLRLPVALGLHLLQLRDVGQDAQSVVLHSDGDQSQTKSVRFEKQHRHHSWKNSKLDLSATSPGRN